MGLVMADHQPMVVAQRPMMADQQRDDDGTMRLVMMDHDLVRRRSVPCGPMFSKSWKTCMHARTRCPFPTWAIMGGAMADLASRPSLVEHVRSNCHSGSRGPAISGTVASGFDG